MEKEEITDPKNILYPPGGILIWALVFLELFTFCIALITLMVSAKNDPDLFHQSRLLLSPMTGAVNTVFLLTSGYFMATSLEKFRSGNRDSARRFLLLTMLGGGLFIALKSFEYSEKISHGYVLGYNTFFTYYWLLTMFHVLHVLVGLVILLSFSFRLKNPDKAMKLEDYEAGTVFWHMCDLIWLILFPSLYLFL